MRYAFIKAYRRVYPVVLMCRLLDVSKSGFYAWLARPASLRSQANCRLDAKIVVISQQHKNRYGAPRITLELHDQNEPCGKNRVAKRMQILGIKGVAAKKFKVTTDSAHNLPIAENLLKQDFSATSPNEKWVSDITYVWTLSGWLYVAVVMDLYSRRIIGWSMNRRMNKQLVCDALLMALWRRGFPKGVIIHSDKGSQYCSRRYPPVSA